MADSGAEERGGEGRRRRHHKRRRDDEGGRSHRSGRSHRRHHRRRRSDHEQVQEQAGHIAKVLQETANVVGYDDEENPFGDENLSRAFVWHKKIEKQIEGGATEQAFSAEQVKKRHEERLKEIEQVKKRRLEREKELAKREEELDVLQKERILVSALRGHFPAALSLVPAPTLTTKTPARSLFSFVLLRPTGRSRGAGAEGRGLPRRAEQDEVRDQYCSQFYLSYKLFSKGSFITESFCSPIFCKVDNI